MLDTLAPAERLAFVLHDMFQLPFSEIAPMVGRSPQAARQLASRARRRVKGAEIPAADADPARQRAVVDAFFRAVRGGDFDTLATLLDPTSCCAPTTVEEGPPPPRSPVARLRLPVRRTGRTPGRRTAPRPGEWCSRSGDHRTRTTFAVMGFTVAQDKIIEIDAIADPDRVRRIAAAVLSDD